MSYKRPFIVDPVLSAIAVGYSNPDAYRIADQVLPRVPVGAEEFKWMEYPLEEAFQVPDAKVGRRGRVQQLEFSGTEKTSSTEDYGLETPIPFSDIDAAAKQRAAKRSTFDPEQHATQMLTETMANIRELRVAGIVHASATYSASRRITLSGTDQLSDYDNSDPIDVLKTGMNGTLVFRPNTWVMSRAGWSKLSSHPKIVNAVRGAGTTDGIVTPQQVIDLFSGEGLQRILIGEAQYNSAKPGQTPVFAQAWGKHIAMLHLNRMATTQPGMITFGYTAEYGGKIAGRIEDKNIGLEGGNMIRSGEKVKELVVAKDTGYFIQNAFA